MNCPHRYDGVCNGCAPHFAKANVRQVCKAACGLISPHGGPCLTSEQLNPVKLADPINPDYYQAGGYEARKVAVAFGFGPYLFNAFKYMCRAGKKGPDATVDLRKAIRMLEFRIEELNGGGK